MTWATVARKDFRDARLSKALWTLTALFVLMAAGMAYLYATVPELRTEVDTVSTIGLLMLLAAPATLFIAIAALVVAVRSVAGERESGSAKLMLGLPHSRGDVIVGKLVGRTAVLAVAILVGLAVTLAIVIGLYPAVSVADYAVFTVLTVLLALVYVGIMVGISATTGSSGRALGIGLGVFVVIEFLADLVPLGVLFVLNGFSLSNLTTVPEWIAFLNVVTPTAAYTNALGWFLGDGTTATAGMAGSLAGPIPFYLTGWVSLLVLALWLLVPLGIGYRRFSRADL